MPAGQEPRVRVVASAAVARSRRPTLWLLAVPAALLVAFVLGRATAGSSSAEPGLAGPGPARSVASVPVGFAHTRAGGVAALLNYAASLGDPRVLLDARRRRQVLSLVATPSYAASFDGRTAAALAAMRRGQLGSGLAVGARTAYLASPIAYRVVSYTAHRAVVDGWGVSIVGNDQGIRPQAAWGTTRAVARWQGGDWKVDSAHTTNGPTPALAPGHTPSAAGDFLARLSGFNGVRHAP
jgi:hypothetical protein